MEVTVNKDAANVAKVSFSVPKDEFQKEYKAGLLQLRKRVQLKGFRPGKAPMPMIEKHHGEEITQEVQQHFLRRAYAQAIENEELKPISHPRVAVDDAKLEEDGSFGLEFEISLRPEVELPVYTGLEIETELEPVMDANVDDAIDEIKRQQSTPDPVGEGGLEENGMAMATVWFLHGEEAVFEREGLRVSPLTPPPGVEADAFKEALVGKADDDVIDIEMTLPDSVEKEEARGEQGTCRIELKQAFNMLPPSDEDLFQMLDVEDEAGLKAAVRERLTEAAQDRENQRMETVLLDRLIDSTNIELPDPLLEEQTKGRLQALGQQMQQQGVPPEDIEGQLEEATDTAREEAAKGLRALLLVEAIGEKEELLVTQEDMETELAAIAQRNQTEIEEVRKYYSENNLGQQMAIELLERKVRGFLREKAEVKTPS